MKSVASSIFALLIVGCAGAEGGSVVLSDNVAPLASTTASPIPGWSHVKTLKGTVRDFSNSHDDFDMSCGGYTVMPGGLQSTLPCSGKPQLATSAASACLSTQANFDQWFSDVSGVNYSFPSEYVFAGGTATAGYATFKNLPVNDLGFGNDVDGTAGDGLNYLYTAEFHGWLQYNGGSREELWVTADDDAWVYINDKLAVDLGGLHGPKTASVNLMTLGLTAGRRYRIDVFYAERGAVMAQLEMVAPSDPIDFVEPNGVPLWPRTKCSLIEPMKPSHTINDEPVYRD